MIKIIGVLGGDQGVHHVLRDFIEIHYHPALFAKFTNQFAIVGEDA